MNDLLNDTLAVAVLREICCEVNQTQSSIAKQLNMEPRAVDSKLQILRRRELVRYDRDVKKWFAYTHAFWFMTAIGAQPTPLEEPEKVVSIDSEKARLDGVEDKGDAPQSVEKEITEENNKMQNTEQTMEKLNIDEVDAAISKARSAAKTGEAPEGAGRKRLTEEERKLKREADEAARAERRAQRESAKREREAQKNTSIPHMSKVEKAAERLPQLSQQAKLLFDHLCVNLTASDITSITAHLTHYNRVQATNRAREVVVNAGDRVKIVSGEARYIGLTGTIAKTQRIRCYVDVDLPNGTTKQVYLFTSDVQPARTSRISDLAPAPEKVAVNE